MGMQLMPHRIEQIKRYRIFCQAIALKDYKISLRRKNSSRNVHSGITYGLQVIHRSLSRRARDLFRNPHTPPDQPKCPFFHVKGEPASKGEFGILIFAVPKNQAIVAKFTKFSLVIDEAR